MMTRIEITNFEGVLREYLTKEELIYRLIRFDFFIITDFSTEFTSPDYDISRELSRLEDAYETYISETKDKDEKLAKYKTMSLFELAELGEKKGCWKLEEKQKRLV